MLPFQSVPALGYAVRAISAEAVMMAHIAAGAALGWAETRHDVYLGSCSDDYDNIWCPSAPTLQHAVRDITIGSLPLTGATAALVAMLRPESFSDAAPLLIVGSQIAVPIFYSPIGAAIGARIFESGKQSPSFIVTAIIGGASVLGIEFAAVVVGAAALVCCNSLCSDHAQWKKCFVDACCGLRRSSPTSAPDVERDLELQTYPLPQAAVITQPPRPQPEPLAQLPAAVVRATHDDDAITIAPAYQSEDAPPTYVKNT